MSTVVGSDTTFGMMLNVRDGEPEKFGTTIVAGTGAMSGRLLARRTVASFENGAMSVSVTRAEDALPPAMVDGVSDSDDSATAQFDSVTELSEVLGSDGLVIVVVCEIVPGPVVLTMNQISWPLPIESNVPTSQVTVFALIWQTSFSR